MIICVFVLLGSRCTLEAVSVSYVVLFFPQPGTEVTSANLGAVGEPNLTLTFSIGY